MASIYERDNYEMSKAYPFRRLTNDERECYLSWRAFKKEYNIKENVPDAIWHEPYFRPEPVEDPTTIINWGKDIKDRKFPYLTQKEKDLWDSRMDEDHSKHEEYLEFFKEECRRREEGLFFYNGDRLEYITGNNYMFLQYWLIPVTTTIKGAKKKVQSNPNFIDAHRDIYYAIDTTKQDKRAAGIVFFGKRRGGKTIVALSDAFWDTTSLRDQRLGLQSKNEPDARKLFKKLISSWKNIPKFWKPNDNKDTNPQKILNFSEDKKKASVKDREYSEAYINSLIEFAPASEEAFDGELYTYLVVDEIGKVRAPLDVHARQDINKECVMDGVDVIGFMFTMSTIEDMEKYASDKAKLIWEESDAEMRDPKLDRTASGLYQLFLPAYYGLSGGVDGDDGEDELISKQVEFVDEWGYSNIKEAHAYVKSMYGFLKGEKLRSFKRKYPITIDDAFNMVDSGNNFSKERLLEQKKHNKNLPIDPVRKGNLLWKNGDKDTGEVVFYPDENGLFEISWMPPEDDRNKWEWRGHQRYPTRDFMRVGVDPVQQSIVREGGSLAGATGVLKHHISYPELDNGVVCTYLYRQEHPEYFFDDMVKLCVFFSSPVLIESNKEALDEHFRQEGWWGFCMKDPLEKDSKKRASPKRGIPTTSKIKRDDMMSSTQAFIYDNFGKNQKTGRFGHCPHDKLIDELLAFNPEKWTDYDLPVSLMLAVIALRDVKKVTTVQKFSIKDWF